MQIRAEKKSGGRRVQGLNASEYAKMETDEEQNFFKFLSGQNADGDFVKTIEEKVSFTK